MSTGNNWTVRFYVERNRNLLSKERLLLSTNTIFYFILFKVTLLIL